MQLLFGHFHAATLSMAEDGGLLLTGARERLLAWGIVFGLLAATALVCWLVNVRRRAAAAVFVVSLLIPALLMPGLRREYIHVLPSRIVVDSGGWPLPSRRTIDLDGVQSIRERQTQFRVAGYIVEANAVWQLEYGDGRRRSVLLDDFFTAHRMAIAQYLRDRGHIVR